MRVRIRGFTIDWIFDLVLDYLEEADYSCHKKPWISSIHKK